MLLRRITLTILATALSLTLVSCDLLGSEEDEAPSTVTADVYVGNQGNFGDGNGSVSIYNPRTENVTPDAITGLSSIIQSISFQNNRLYITANSAARLDVFDTETLDRVEQLTDFDGPRYLTFSNGTAFMTDQSFEGTSKIRVLDAAEESFQKTDSISVSGAPEGITATESRVYASLGAFGMNTLVAAVDADQQELIEEIDIGCSSRVPVADAQDEVFVFCTDAAEAVILAGSSGEIQSRLSLPDTAETTSSIGTPATFSDSAEEIHVVTDTGILRIDTQSNTVTSTIDVDSPSSISAVGYDANREELYLGRSSGFTERGTVTVHERDGTEINSFQVGIAPVSFAFDQQQE